jgi:acetyl esterase/lipase
MQRLILATAMALALAGAAAAAPHPAIFTDPPADKAHPARSEVLHIPTGGGLKINGLAYLAAGDGAHPTVVLLHGLPGNEKNLDLAQAIRRAGWNVVTFNYRGSWGSPGTYTFRGNVEDVKAALVYVRDPANAARLQVDTRRIVLMGHSMGGGLTAIVGGQDDGLAGAVLISAADLGILAAAPKAVRLKTAADNMETLAGVTAESMADELGGLDAKAFSFAGAAPGLAKKPVLILTSDDGLAPVGNALVMNLKMRGAPVATVHAAADHSWDEARILLETTIVEWLGRLPK